ncbi:MAG TPA: response regulator transcription factor [Symbiobacteriaceae bacterium]|nr:response regulator transcription factor [Symbiobacteriaceae bacterium]
METLRLLLVEDQTVVREGLRQLVESEPGLTVAGEAGTVAEATALAAERRPDVVLLDLKLPDGSGLEAARRMLATPHPPAVLVLSTYEDVALVRSALELGVSGYIPKSASFQEIVAAVRAAAAGGVVLHPALAGKLARPGAAEPTDQELRMLRMLADGASYGEIGAGLYLSERTVRRHMNVLFAKLGCSSRAAAVAEALRRGLLA